MMDIDTIIWDWNGTLLDDAETCIATINVLLGNRNLPLLDKEKYLEIFGFPVKDYYEHIGFDFKKEPFEIPAHQFIDGYTSAVMQASLHENVQELLGWFDKRNYKQFVLSASEQNSLDKLLQHFNIRSYFEAVAGLNNHYATSKEEIGIQLLKENHILPAKACLIGDTIHDFEVAEAMGCQCILIANGHQNYKRLKETGTTVLNKLQELEHIF